MKTQSIALCLTMVSLTACKKSEDKNAPAPKPSEGVTAPSVAAPVVAAPAAAADGGDVDLSPAGAAWKGWTVKAPAGSEIRDNGAGGAIIELGSISFEATQGDFDIKLIKSGAEFGAKEGKITFQVDKADELAYTTEISVGGGAPIKGYGFAYSVKVAGKKVGCSSTLDSEEQVAKAKAACNSIMKK
jgi:hypothetical protein